MAQQFEDQGGMATMDPPAPLRWLTSRVMSRFMGIEAAERRRARAEKARRRAGAPHRVEYFHQIEDGYSHLAAQLLRPLLDHYDVELVCHLVTVENDRNLPEPDLLPPLARRDCAAVAPHYGLRFPEGAGAPQSEQIGLGARILTAVDQADFPEVAVAVGDALWADDAGAMNALAERYGCVDTATRDVSFTVSVSVK